MCPNPVSKWLVDSDLSPNSPTPELDVFTTTLPCHWLYNRGTCVCEGTRNLAYAGDTERIGKESCGKWSQEDRCHGPKNRPRRCPGPDPWNLGICYLTWQNGFSRCDKVKDLRWGDDPGLQGGGPALSRESSQEGGKRVREGAVTSRSPSGVNTGGPLILGREGVGSPPKPPEATQLYSTVPLAQ